MEWKVEGPRVSLGSSTLAPSGWLSTDITSEAGQDVRLDLTKPLPFASESIAYFHAEHVIEHFEPDAAAHLLDEAFRCLKAGGVLRLATPDATLFLDLGRTIEGGGREGREWQDWVVAANRRWQVPEDDVTDWLFAVNRAFSSWGHRFLYTRDYLDRVLQRHRFLTEWQRVGESRFIDLRQVERHGERGGPRENDMHTMVVDAIKAS
jgi:SAM-dependent methyltransferase